MVNSYKSEYLVSLINPGYLKCVSIYKYIVVYVVTGQNMEVTKALRFEPGDVIQDYCEPFVKILHNSIKGERCDYCFEKSDRLQRCGKCRKMSYCDRDCQTKDWKLGHQLECRSAFFQTDSAAFPSSIVDFKYRLLRLFFLLRTKPKLSQVQYKIYDGTTRCFDDLMSHQKHVKEQSEFVRLCTEIVNNLLNEAEYKHENKECLLEYFLKLSGIFKTNAFCIYNEDKTQPIGAGVYIEASVFDHSCKPTAFFVGHGVKMQIRAIGPIPKNEKPRISYILAHKGKAARHQFLTQRYNFVCDCERCNDATEHAIDFDRIYQLLESQSSHDEDSTENWKLVIKRHNELLTNFRKLYHEYDERITNQLYWVFTALQPNSSSILSAEIWNNLVAETEKHLLTTYGNEYVYYKAFQRQVLSSSGSQL